MQLSGDWDNKIPPDTILFHTSHTYWMRTSAGSLQRSVPCLWNHCIHLYLGQQRGAEPESQQSDS